MVKPICYGRLGNFLFQAATAIAYGLRHNVEFTLPNKTSRPAKPKWNPVYLQYLVNPNWNPGLPVIRIEEQGFPYQELPFIEPWLESNIVLDGYWQSEKYFKDFRKEIIELFDLPWKLQKGFVSVHVRRGDYLRLPKKHPQVPVSWIKEQMFKFPGYQFMFFSDDIPWCKQNFGRYDHCCFSEGKTEIEDLALQSSCEHHICSASTFSWWSAWLNQNPNKKIIIPKLWFVPGWNGIDIKDIVPSEWERV